LPGLLFPDCDATGFVVADKAELLVDVEVPERAIGWAADFRLVEPLSWDSVTALSLNNSNKPLSRYASHAHNPANPKTKSQGNNPPDRLLLIGQTLQS